MLSEPSLLGIIMLDMVLLIQALSTLSTYMSPLINTFCLTNKYKSIPKISILPPSPHLSLLHFCTISPPILPGWLGPPHKATPDYQPLHA